MSRVFEGEPEHFEPVFQKLSQVFEGEPEHFELVVWRSTGKGVVRGGGVADERDYWGV